VSHLPPLTSGHTERSLAISTSHYRQDRRNRRNRQTDVFTPHRVVGGTFPFHLQPALTLSTPLGFRLRHHKRSRTQPSLSRKGWITPLIYTLTLDDCMTAAQPHHGWYNEGLSGSILIPHLQYLQTYTPHGSSNLAYHPPWKPLQR
jgi:hypothetical protein